MPWDFDDAHPTQTLHFLTLTCRDRLPLLNTPAARDRFEQALEKTQRLYRLQLHGYVVMPEHVHLLLAEPRSYPLANAVQSLKQITAQRLHTDESAFWQPRFDDHHVTTDRKRLDKLNAIHQNPVKRGLAARPEDWLWSSVTGALVTAPATPFGMLNSRPPQPAAPAARSKVLA